MWDLPAVEWLLDHGMDPNLPGERGISRLRGNATPMNLMAWDGAQHKEAVEIMELLVSRGATLDPFVLENAIVRRGQPRYQLEVLQWLVDHGADVNFPLQAGYTMIFKAIQSRDIQLVEFLLRNGANTSVRRSRDNETPLEFARMVGVQEICDAIEQHQNRDLNNLAAIVK
jgi:ankyrin repeat protein